MGTTTRSARRTPARSRGPDLLCMTCTVELIERTIQALEDSMLSDEGSDRLSNSDEPAPVEYAIMTEAVVQPVLRALCDFAGEGRGSDPILSGIFGMLCGFGDYVQAVSCVGVAKVPGAAHFIIGLPSLLTAAADRLREMIAEHSEPQLGSTCADATPPDGDKSKYERDRDAAAARMLREGYDAVKSVLSP